MGIILPFIADAEDIAIFTAFFISAAVLLVIVLFKVIREKELSLPRSPLYYLPLLFLGYVAFGQTYSINPAATRFGVMLLFSAVICGLSIPMLNPSGRVLKWLSVTLITAVTVFSIYGIYQYVTVTGNYSGRAHSVFVNPNTFSGYLVLVMPLTISIYLAGGRNEKYFLLPAVVQYLALLASGKGGRWMVFLAAVSFVLFFYRVVFPRMSGSRTGAVLKGDTSGDGRSFRGRFGLLLVVLSAATLIFFLMPFGTAHEAVPGSVSEAFPAMLDRFRIWKSTWDVVKDNPLFGTGYFTFHNIYLKYKHAEFVNVNHFFTHNDYLQLLSEIGILGLGIFAALIYFYLRDGVRILRRDNIPVNDKYILAGILLGSFIMLVHTSIDYDLYIAGILLVFWCYVGYVINISMRSGLHETFKVDMSRNPLFNLIGVKKAYIVVSAAFLFLTLWLMTPYLSSRHGKMGDDSMRSGDYERAVTYYKKAIDIDPIEASHRYNLAVALIKLKDRPDRGVLERVEREMRKAIDLDPYRPELSFSLANLYLEYYPEKKGDEAIELLKRVMEIDPTDLNNRLNLAKAFRRLGMDEEAAREFEDVQRVHTKKADSHM